MFSVHDPTTTTKIGQGIGHDLPNVTMFSRHDLTTATKIGQGIGHGLPNSFKLLNLEHDYKPFDFLTG